MRSTKREGGREELVGKERETENYLYYCEQYATAGRMQPVIYSVFDKTDPSSGNIRRGVTL